MLSAGDVEKGSTPGCPVEITLEVTEGTPNDIVSGRVTGVDPDKAWVMVYVRTDKWYIQPFADQRVYLTRPLGYGTYIFRVSSRVDLLDQNVVGSLFLYRDDDHELAVEFSR